MGDVHPAVTKAERHLLFFLVAPSWLVGVCALLPEKVKERGMKKKKKHISGMGDPSLACRSQFLPYGRAVGMVKPLLVRERLPSPTRKSNLRSWVKKSIRYLRLQAERPKREQNTAVRLGEKW